MEKKKKEQRACTMVGIWVFKILIKKKPTDDTPTKKKKKKKKKKKRMEHSFGTWEWPL